MGKTFRNVAVVVLATFTFASTPAWAQKEDYGSLLQEAIKLNSSGPFAGNFDTLIAAVLAADPSIAVTLSAKGQHTVFAPTDDAFLALGLDETNIGDALPRETLTTVLEYHLVHGRLAAEDVLAADRLNTLIKGRGGFVEQTGGVLIDNLDRTSTIIATDVKASNGIIHAISGVLLPVSP